VQAYLDEVAPASIVGRMIKFNKEGQFVCSDNDEAISEDTDFTALCDQTLIGWIKFNNDAPPDRVMGLLYDGFVMPGRDTLGDTDKSKWDLGLDGHPADPWQHHVYAVLQRGDTAELFTYNNVINHRPSRHRQFVASLRAHDARVSGYVSGREAEDRRLSAPG